MRDAQQYAAEPRKQMQDIAMPDYLKMLDLDARVLKERIIQDKRFGRKAWEQNHYVWYVESVKK